MPVATHAIASLLRLMGDVGTAAGTAWGGNLDKQAGQIGRLGPLAWWGGLASGGWLWVRWGGGRAGWLASLGGWGPLLRGSLQPA